ncbi:hypothetical protein C0081_04900 [Cohaesibacter celericrescens]|uniref:Uncharacterized protein n=1 Tax=Cohaesibacter celericrescens TaxID=2067669 RepID=A0A2N5XV83_9HYPH|nr:hypothetical protein C0081_04900 [Cohaesibacter celericrescens]
MKGSPICGNWVSGKSGRNPFLKAFSALERNPAASQTHPNGQTQRKVNFSFVHLRFAFDLINI